MSQTVARMHRDGLVDLTDDRRLRLTEEGRRIATAVLRKHRVVERLLVDVIGLELDHAHEEACRWEHVVSDRVEARIVALLGDPVVSPFGNPIPGQGGRRRAPPPAWRPGRCALSDVARRHPRPAWSASASPPRARTSCSSPSSRPAWSPAARSRSRSRTTAPGWSGGRGANPVRLVEPTTRHVLLQPLG